MVRRSELTPDDADRTMQVWGLRPLGSQNPRFKQFVSLKRNLRPNPEHLVTLEGLWEVTQALTAGLELRAAVIAPTLLRGDAGRQVAQRLVDSGVHAYQASEAVFRRLVDRDGPDGLAAIACLPSWDWGDIVPSETSRIVVLDSLEIVGNVGSVIRTADAVGADAVVLSDRRIRPTHPKLVHSSLGASLWMPILDSDAATAIAWLKERSYQIVVTDAEAGVSYRDPAYASRAAIVLGSERYGLSTPWRQVADLTVGIPMLGRSDSLNVGNAAALVLYEALAHQHAHARRALQ